VCVCVCVCACVRACVCVRCVCLLAVVFIINVNDRLNNAVFHADRSLCSLEADLLTMEAIKA
jgi:hypothetical protein